MQIKTRTRWPHRCSKCRTRHTFRLRIEQYQRPPKCRNCGDTHFYVDKWMLRRNTKADKCWCDGYRFPHRRGSKWCNEFSGELTDADYGERHHSMVGVW